MYQTLVPSTIYAQLSLTVLGVRHCVQGVVIQGSGAYSFSLPCAPGTCQ